MESSIVLSIFAFILCIFWFINKCAFFKHDIASPNLPSFFCLFFQKKPKGESIIIRPRHLVCAHRNGRIIRPGVTWARCITVAEMSPCLGKHSSIRFCAGPGDGWWGCIMLATGTREHVGSTRTCWTPEEWPGPSTIHYTGTACVRSMFVCVETNWKRNNVLNVPKETNLPMVGWHCPIQIWFLSSQHNCSTQHPAHPWVTLF